MVASLFTSLLVFRDTKLLSFQDDEAADEEPVVFKKKAIVRPDREWFYNFLAIKVHANFLTHP